MVQIADISPTSPASTNRSVTGRIRSIACSPHKSAVFVGCSSNLWFFSDEGRSFKEAVRPQPPGDQYVVAGGLCAWCAAEIAAGIDGNQFATLALMSFDLANFTTASLSREPTGSGEWADRCTAWTQVHLSST
jgi:hypothetical protein